MEKLIIPLAIAIGAFIIAYAIERTSKNREQIDSNRAESDEKLAQLNTVSNVAGFLIAGTLSNSKYIAAIEQLEDERIDVATSDLGKESLEQEERIKEAEEQLDRYNVFHYKGRRKFIELAWDIYDEISREQKNRL